MFWPFKEAKNESFFCTISHKTTHLKSHVSRMCICRNWREFFCWLHWQQSKSHFLLMCWGLFGIGCIWFHTIYGRKCLVSCWQNPFGLGLLTAEVIIRLLKSWEQNYFFKDPNIPYFVFRLLIGTFENEYRILLYHCFGVFNAILLPLFW